MFIYNYSFASDVSRVCEHDIAPFVFSSLGITSIRSIPQIPDVVLDVDDDEVHVDDISKRYMTAMQRRLF